MSDGAELTNKQQRIYDHITRRIEVRGFPPTIREIGEAFGIKSPNGVMCHLKALEKKGFIVREGQHARAISLTNRGPAPGCLPFKGLVAAGPPLASVEQDERLDLTELFAGPGHMALKVRGTSMIESHIADGDIVIIKEQPDARNGEKVVAVVDGEVTLKTFKRKGDLIILEPANGAMQPIVLDDTRDVRIVGLLVGVIRKF